MADEIKAIEPNKLLMLMSKALRPVKEGLNYPGKLPQSVPLLGGMGAGDLIIGEAPEALEDYAHGFGPFGKGKGWTTRMDTRLVDIAGLPLPYVGAYKAGKMGVQKLMAKKLRNEPAEEIAPDIGRREALKKIGGIGAIAAGAAAVPDLALMAGKAVAPDVGRAAAGAAVKSNPHMIAALDKASDWFKSDRFGQFMGDAEWADITDMAMSRATHALKDNPEFIQAYEEAVAKYGQDVIDKTMSFRGTVSEPYSAYWYTSKEPKFVYTNEAGTKGYPTHELEDIPYDAPNRKELQEAAAKWVAENPDKYDEMLLFGRSSDIEAAPPGVAWHEVVNSDEASGPIARMTRLMWRESGDQWDKTNNLSDRIDEFLQGNLQPQTTGEKELMRLIDKHGGDVYFQHGEIDELVKKHPDLVKTSIDDRPEIRHANDKSRKQFEYYMDWDKSGDPSKLPGEELSYGDWSEKFGPAYQSYLDADTTWPFSKWFEEFGKHFVKTSPTSGPGLPPIIPIP